MNLALQMRTGGLRWLWACAGGAALLTSEPVTAAPLSGASLDAQVVLHTQQHRLLLCEQGQPVTEYRVALGRGGAGEQREGDLKTPLGVYSLGLARTSAEFGLFLPAMQSASSRRGCASIAPRASTVCLSSPDRARRQKTGFDPRNRPHACPRQRGRFRAASHSEVTISRMISQGVFSVGEMSI